MPLTTKKNGIEAEDTRPGFDVARALTGVAPDLAVLLVSADDRHMCRESVRDCGAHGFVLKARLVDADLSTFWRQVGGP